MRYYDKYQDKQGDKLIKTLQDFCKRKREKGKRIAYEQQQSASVRDNASKNIR